MGELDFPAGKIHEVFAIKLVTPDVEADLHILFGFEIIEQRAFVFHDFKFQILRVFVVVSGHHEFAFGETAWERLGFVDQFDFSCDLVHARMFPIGRRCQR